MYWSKVALVPKYITKGRVQLSRHYVFPIFKSFKQTFYRNALSIRAGMLTKVRREEANNTILKLTATYVQLVFHIKG